MSDVLNPVKLGHHLFLFLKVLLIFFCFVYFVLLELLFNFVNLLMEKSTDIGLLLN